jgi:signal peptidase
MSDDDGSRPPSDSATSDRTDSTDRAGASGDGPADRPSASGDGQPEGFLTRLATAEGGPLLLVRETGLSVGAVAAVGLVLFAISGVWPPMVAVESGSMEPHMHRGDLVFMTEPGRFAGDGAHADTGVVTRATGAETGHWKFGGYGSVVVYDDPGSAGPPVIHRAQFWVEDGENWYDMANPDYVGADDCDEMSNCPAPHAGFVTKGDNNARYDQVNGISEPVKPGWVVGVARVRIPYLGWIRLGVSEMSLDTTFAGAGVGRSATPPGATVNATATA